MLKSADFEIYRTWGSFLDFLEHAFASHASLLVLTDNQEREPYREFPGVRVT